MSEGSLTFNFFLFVGTYIVAVMYVGLFFFERSRTILSTFWGKEGVWYFLFSLVPIIIRCPLDTSASLNLQGKMAERLRRVTQAL